MSMSPFGIGNKIIYIAALASALTLNSCSRAIYTHGSNSLEQKIEQCEQKSTALFIIDLQDRFLEGIDSAEFSVELPNYIALIQEAQKNNIPIYVFEYKDCGRTTQKLLEVLANSDYERVIKSEDCCFEETDLNHQLKIYGIDKIILTGVNASGCILKTAKSAISNGFVIGTSRDVIADSYAHMVYSDMEESIDWYNEHGTVFKSHKEIIEYFRKCN